MSWQGFQLRRARRAAATSDPRVVRTRPHVARVEPALLEHVAQPLERRRRTTRVGVRDPATSRTRIRAGVASPAACATSIPSESRRRARQLRQVHQDPHDAVRRAPQPERIARSGRPLAGA